MAFMEPVTTDSQEWVEIDGDHGITFLPILTVTNTSKAFLARSEEDQLQAVAMYYEGTPDKVSIREGFGARFSANGYLDCTPWSVFDTHDQAEEFLKSESEDDETEEDDTDDETPECPHGNGDSCTIC